jgi:hypothetical protein
MSEFKRYVAAMMDRAVVEAGRDRSPTVEAQHLLLAVLGDNAVEGLGQDAFRVALEREFERSLGAAGVSAAAFDVAPATPDPDRSPNLGASVQLALERGLKAAGRSTPRPVHLLVGILSAEVGTVPRALELAGVDRVELLGRVREVAS